jgi:predicted nucleic acid-binding protein
MNYLLDTCVISEFTQKKPEKKVIEWMDHVDEEMLFLSVITIGEIQYGIERLPDSQRKIELLTWMNDGLLHRFSPRILNLDSSIMYLWGSLTARFESLGKPMGVMDSLIAATALQHNLIIVTRNVSDFIPCGVQILNPWY